MAEVADMLADAFLRELAHIARPVLKISRARRR